MVHRDIEAAGSRGVRDTKKVRRVTVLLTLCLVTVLAGHSTAAPDRPNVVIFLADDLGWADVGFHGGPIETPHIDRLAREGVEVGAEKPLDGIDMWPAISEGRKVKRDGYLFFASEIPRHGSFKLTAFNEEWKLVQLVEQDIQSTSVQNMLFRIREDPYEYNDLASQHPDVMADLSERIYEWRSQYPISGTRVHLMPPPGWRAPRDWATYATPKRELQDEAAPGYPPDAFKLRVLDWMHRGRGRLIYE